MNLNHLRAFCTLSVPSLFRASEELQIAQPSEQGVNDSPLEKELGTRCV